MSALAGFTRSNITDYLNQSNFAPDEIAGQSVIEHSKGLVSDALNNLETARAQMISAGEEQSFENSKDILGAANSFANTQGLLQAGIGAAGSIGYGAIAGADTGGVDQTNPFGLGDLKLRESLGDFSALDKMDTTGFFNGNNDFGFNTDLGGFGGTFSTMVK